MIKSLIGTIIGVCIRFSLYIALFLTFTPVLANHVDTVLIITAFITVPLFLFVNLMSIFYIYSLHKFFNGKINKFDYPILSESLEIASVNAYNKLPRTFVKKVLKYISILSNFIFGSVMLYYDWTFVGSILYVSAFISFMIYTHHVAMIKNEYEKEKN